MKTYCIDIDGTICTDEKGDYSKVIPYISRIHKINELFKKGNKIILYSGRGLKTNSKRLTKKQLKEWGIYYTKLIFKKPYYDFWVDDKAINSKDFFK